MFDLPSAYRVIHVPVYFWISCFIYLIITYELFLKKQRPLSQYLKEGVYAAFFLHVYLLLGNLIGFLSKSPQMLSGIYIVYIKAVFLAATAAVCSRPVRQIFLCGRVNPAGLLIYAPFTASSLYFFLSNLWFRDFGFASLIFAAIIAGQSLCASKGIVNTAPRKLFSRDINAAIAIFITAFIIRTAFGVMLVNRTTHGPYGYDGYLCASDDGLTFDATANKIVKDPSSLKKGEVAIWGTWDQCYSVFLAGFYKLFGRNFYILTIFQAFLGAFIPLFIFMIGRAVFSKEIGLIAGIALSFKGGLILLSAYMGHEAVWLPILYLLIFLLAGYFKNPHLLAYSRCAAIGLAAGILAMFRSLYLYLLPYLAVWVALTSSAARNIRALARFAVIAAVAAGVILNLLSLVNNKVTFMNSGKGEYLWRTSRVSPPFQHLGNERLEAIGINPFKDPKGSLDAIVKDPLRFLLLGARIYPLRVVAYFEAYQFGQFDPTYMVNPAKIKNRFASTLEFYFTVFFLTGLVLCFRKERGVLGSPVFLILTYHVIFFCFILSQQAPRLKEISSPLVYLIGSFGANAIYNFLKERKDI